MIIDAETNKKLDESHCYFEDPIKTNKELDKDRTEEVLQSTKYLGSGKRIELFSPACIQGLGHTSPIERSDLKSCESHCYKTEFTETRNTESESNLIETLCDGRCGIDAIYKTLLHPD